MPISDVYRLSSFFNCAQTLRAYAGRPIDSSNPNCWWLGGDTQEVPRAMWDGGSLTNTALCTKRVLLQTNLVNLTEELTRFLELPKNGIRQISTSAEADPLVRCSLRLWVNQGFEILCLHADQKSRP